MEKAKFFLLILILSSLTVAILPSENGTTSIVQPVSGANANDAVGDS